MDINQFTAWFDGLMEPGNGLKLWLTIALCVLGICWIAQAILTGALARSKGYAFVGNFLLGLFFGLFALIYEVGRPVSYERECVMQDRLALQVAKEMFKLQRAREKSMAHKASTD